MGSFGKLFLLLFFRIVLKNKNRKLFFFFFLSFKKCMANYFGKQKIMVKAFEQPFSKQFPLGKKTKNCLEFLLFFCFQF